jgi:hypothetical protein
MESNTLIMGAKLQAKFIKCVKKDLDFVWSPDVWDERINRICRVLLRRAIQNEWEKYLDQDFWDEWNLDKDVDINPKFV